MALPEMSVALPEISIEAKRELPDFVREEQRAQLRLAEPEIPRPVWPSYAFIRQRTPDLSPQPTTEDVELWRELRMDLLHQTNHPRWTGSIAIGTEFHTVGWYSVVDTVSDHHCALRCSCCLPAFDEPDSDEYQPCPAQDAVIEERARTYHDLLGVDVAGTPGGLKSALSQTVDIVRHDQLIWPPSHRSDMLLADGLALTFGVSPQKILDAALTLQGSRVLDIIDADKPILRLAA